MALKYNVKRNLIWIASIAILLLIILFIPIKVPYTIDAPGKILPVKEWIVLKGGSGEIVSQLIDYRNGHSSRYNVSQFERGEASALTFNNEILSRGFVNANDTIATISNNFLERELSRLEGELEIANATLNFYLTGEKAAIIKEVEEEINFKKKQAEEQKKILDRMEKLHDKGLISTEEYEIARGKYELNKIDVDIAEAKMQTVLTGAKNEQISLVRAEIKSLEHQIKQLQSDIDDFSITSPISGKVTSSFSTDTLLLVSDISEVIVVMPVNWQEKLYLSEGQEVDLTIPFTQNSYTAKINAFDKNVKFLSGNQVIVTKAYFYPGSEEIFPGLLIKCSIDCGEITIAEYLSRLIKTVT